MRATTVITVLLLLIALAVLVSTPGVGAQQVRQVHRIGVLVGGLEAPPAFVHFRQGMRDLGYVEGTNLVIEYRLAHGQADRLPELAADLVRLKVDVIVAVFVTPTRAAHQATRSIPIVMIGAADPVGVGLAASLARPGGNVTGTVSSGDELGGKLLELFKGVLPNLKQLAVLWNPSNPVHAPLRKDWDPAARSLAIQLQWLPAANPQDLEGAFRSAARDAAAVLVLGDAMFLGHRDRIAALATDARLPTLFIASGHADAGGLMSYGPDPPDLFRRPAAYVDKILKGAKPADLPIERPTKFEFVVNLRTAKALGLTIPPTVLLQATRIIE
jgi:putative ABC transport system substrate-binding protein